MLIDIPFRLYFMSQTFVLSIFYFVLFSCVPFCIIIECSEITGRIFFGDIFHSSFLFVLTMCVPFIVFHLRVKSEKKIRVRKVPCINNVLELRCNNNIIFIRH